MQPGEKAASSSKVLFWIGWVLSVLPVPLLAMSAVAKLTKSEQMMEGFKHLGWDENLAIPLAVVEISCTVLFLIPQTAVLGAILLTGYLGGAVATHVRVGDAFYIQALLGMVPWLGLYFRDPRIRGLAPIRSLR
jgi:hypothetical protein